MASAHCKSHTDAYRNCLRECRDAGRSKTASKTCKPLAVRLDQCREDWRRTSAREISNQSQPRTKRNTKNNNDSSNTNRSLSFDGTRVLPHPKCRPLSCDVQKCIQWKKGDQSKCRDEIQKLRDCMQSTEGTVAEPTEGDKVWSV